MKDELETRNPHDLQGRFGASARGIVTVDVAKYQAYLDGSGLTEAQKEEFLQALWSVVVNFVELGFAVHPVQEVCGQTAETTTERPIEDFNAVGWEEPGIE